MSYAHAIPETTPALRDPLARGVPYPNGFIDAVIAAGALAAWSDGRVHPVERLEMLVYMRRSGLSLLRRRDVLEIFDQRVRELERDPGSATQAAFDLIGRFSGSGLAWTVLRAAEHVAAADARMHDSEVTAIRSIGAALGIPSDDRWEPLSA
jgi:tellurite resistance protein